MLVHAEKRMVGLIEELNCPEHYMDILPWSCWGQRKRESRLIGRQCGDSTLLRRDKADLMKAVINSFPDEDNVNEAENVHIQRMSEMGVFF